MTEKAKIKVPKGTRDIMPYQAAVREQVLNEIICIFKKHGAVTIETPVFELKEILVNKYGEDSKLIYDLKDQGGELCSLRYDLTVPFARYIALHGIDNMKRYQIAKVYRRDQPIMTKGRFREFYQCDFDIAGQYAHMMPDAECCLMINEILTKIDIGKYIIKINHRELLIGICEICNIAPDMFNPVFASIDKLDKKEWAFINNELIEKGLTQDIIDKLKIHIEMKGTIKNILEYLNSLGTMNQHIINAVTDITKLLEYVDIYDIQCIIFDMSLVRGLDYYTGLIYEAILVDGENIGSIAGGGRYDNLVGMYGSTQIPCVGFSIGIERLFNIIETNAKSKNIIRESPTDVIIIAIGNDMDKHRMALIRNLWRANIRAEMVYKNDPKIREQLDYANKLGVPFVCIIGTDEIQQNLVIVKDMKNRTQESIMRIDIAEYLKKLLF